ncbi:MAG: DNA adenine methylase [Planctomycetaceae bacterium]|jgi:DNA adenine methylase|nr:DNA adenine methylase [Planctomycetaceae bacterium]
MKYKRIRSPFKYHGSKDPIAGEIVELMKGGEHLTYMEPFCGAASVLLAKDPSNTSEIANDVYEHIYDFFSVLRDGELYEELVRLCQLTPFSEATWRRAQEILASDGVSQVERAYGFYVSVQQSRQGLQKDFATSSKTRTRGGRNEQVNAYFSGVNRLPEIHQRLQNVMFFNRDALKMIESQDLDSRLIYADPPYVPETRIARNAYLHEMSNEDHHHLVDAFLASKSKIMLSGYPGSETIYKRLEDADWGVWRRGVVKHSSSQKVKPKTFEQIWANFELNTEHANRWERVASSDQKLFTGSDCPRLVAPRPLPEGYADSSSPKESNSIPRDTFPESHVPVPRDYSAPAWLKLRPLLKMTVLDQINTADNKGTNPADPRICGTSSIHSQGE